MSDEAKVKAKGTRDGAGKSRWAQDRESTNAARRQADRAAVKEGALRTLWIVRDPSPVSDLSDICWEVGTTANGSAPRLDRIILGSDRDAMVSENWRFYATEDEARADAEERLAAVR